VVWRPQRRPAACAFRLRGAAAFAHAVIRPRTRRRRRRAGRTRLPF